MEFNDPTLSRTVKRWLGQKAHNKELMGVVGLSSPRLRRYEFDKSTLKSQFTFIKSLQLLRGYIDVG